MKNIFYEIKRNKLSILRHEIKRNSISLIVWSLSIAFMLGITILIYPEMSSQMGELSNMFADMGAFSDAFGMDQLNFGEFMGYFGVECGNTLGLGGALFAAILGINALCKDERDRTAEFILSHPISRGRVVTEKLLAVIFQLTVMNLTVVAVTVICTIIVGVDADAGKLALLFLANYLLQLEIAAITFGISAFLRGNGLGIGLGLVLIFYFMNILSNITEELEFLKYITPYGYTDGAYIVSEGTLEPWYITVGFLLCIVGLSFAYVKYTKKDIS